MKIKFKECTVCGEMKRSSSFSNCKDRDNLVCNMCSKEQKEFIVVCSTDGCKNKFKVNELQRFYKCDKCKGEE